MRDRGAYYVARGLSSQLGPLTNQTNYNLMEKVISIWIVSEGVPEKLQNTVTSYRFESHDIIGEADVPKEYYDKMELVVVRRGTDGTQAASDKDYLDKLLAEFQTVIAAK